MENKLYRKTRGNPQGRNKANRQITGSRPMARVLIRYGIQNLSNNTRLSKQSPFLTWLFIGSFQIKIEPFLLRWFVLPIWASIFPRAIILKIFNRNFITITTTTTVTNMIAAGDDRPSNSEWGVDSVSLFQQLINLHSGGTERWWSRNKMTANVWWNKLTKCE